MPAFKYKGYNRLGEQVSGELVCTNLEDAERRVSALDISITAMNPVRSRSGRSDASEDRPSGRRLRKTSDADAADILGSLAVMVDTGVPFVEALDAVAAGAKTPAITEALEAMKSEIVGGRSLSAVLLSADTLFPPIVGEMVKVAEEGGRLDQALNAAAEHLERSAELRRRVMSAMLYPMVMASISFLTVIILIVFVLPKFATVFSKIGAEVPLSTQMMLGAGTLLRGHPIASVASFLGFIACLKVLLMVPATSDLAGLLLRKSPVVGGLIKKLALSRAFQAIATLLAGNVPLVSALEHGANIAGDKAVGGALRQVRAQVEQGRSFSEVLTETGVFPKSLVQFAAIGERTGRLGPLMATCANALEKDADAKLKALVSIIEPLMIVFMGLTVGTITVSIISPIYSVVQNVK